MSNTEELNSGWGGASNSSPQNTIEEFIIFLLGIVLNFYNNLWIKVLHKFTFRFRSLQKQDLTIEVLAQYLKKPNPLIIEIGSNIGQTTVEFIQFFPDSKLICFEPDLRAIKEFKANPKLADVELHNFALSDVESKQEIEFYASGGDFMKNEVTFEKGWNQSGSIMKPKIHKIVNPWCTFDHKTKVVTDSLDNWSIDRNIDFIDLIWMDVQGAESRVILGAQEVLKRTKYLYFEYSIYELYEKQVKLKNVLKLLKDFKVVQIYPRDVLLVNKNFN